MSMGCYCDELAEGKYGSLTCTLCELDFEYAMKTLGRNLAVAGALHAADAEGAKYGYEQGWRDAKETYQW